MLALRIKLGFNKDKHIATYHRGFDDVHGHVLTGTQMCFTDKYIYNLTTLIIRGIILIRI